MKKLFIFNLSTLVVSFQVVNRETNTEEVEVLLGPTNVESSIKIIKVSEEDLPEKVLNKKFDQVKITIRRSAESVFDYGVSKITLNGNAKLKDHFADKVTSLFFRFN